MIFGNTEPIFQPIGCEFSNYKRLTGSRRFFGNLLEADSGGGTFGRESRKGRFVGNPKGTITPYFIYLYEMRVAGGGQEEQVSRVSSGLGTRVVRAAALEKEQRENDSVTDKELDATRVELPIRLDREKPNASTSLTPADGPRIAQEMDGLSLILRGEGSPVHSEDLRALADRVRNLTLSAHAVPVSEKELAIDYVMKLLKAASIVLRDYDLVKGIYIADQIDVAIKSPASGKEEAPHFADPK